jgi:type IVB pilus formation R64 PilN family outer membrane protein
MKRHIPVYGLRVTTACAVIATLAGCAMPSIRETDRLADEIVAQADFQKTRQTELLKQQSLKAADSATLDYWIGARPVNAPPKRVTPFDDRNVVLKGSYDSLADIAETITRDTGIVVRLAREQIPSANEKLLMNFSGKLSGGLDTVAARYGVFWRASGNDGVVFALTDTRVFQIRTVGERVDSTVVITGDQSGGGSGGSSGGSSSGGGGSQSTTLSSNLSAYQSMSETINAMKSPVGKVAVTPGAGSIAVTDVPEVLDRMERAVSQINDHVSRQIAFEVRLYSLQLKRSDDYGFDYNALFSSLTGNYGVRLVSNSAASQTAPYFAVSVPQGATGSAARWSGSELIARALSEQGKVTQLTSAVLRTYNHKPVQFQRANSFTYVSGTTTTTSANVGSTTSTQQSRENVGMFLNLIPNAYGDGRVGVQVFLKMSGVRPLRTIKQGSGQSQSTTEAIDVDSAVTSQSIEFKSGETMVFAGYESVNNTSNLSGVGHPSNTLFGGAKGNNSRDVIVMTLTPVVLESN